LSTIVQPALVECKRIYSARTEVETAATHEKPVSLLSCLLSIEIQVSTKIVCKRTV